MTRLLLAFFLLFAGPALAQETPDEERSYLLGLVEDQLSTPNRQIRINGIQGVLSSNATIGEITIADREGVWLRIVNARIVWSRRALLLGRLDIDTLAAERIEVTRRPLPDEGLPPPEAGGFALPEIPLTITLDELNIDNATFDESVFGLASQLALTGRLRLADGSLDTALEVNRLDGPGGRLALAATYANATQVLGLDLSLTEPGNGVVANLLGIEGRPPVALSLKGEGPLSELDLALTLDADAERVLTGTTRLRREPTGLAFGADVGGAVSRLIAPAYRTFFGAESRLVVSGQVKDAGGVRLDALDLQTGALSVNGSLETASDNFIQRLTLDAVIDDPASEAIVLPVPGGNTKVNRAEVQLRYGEIGADEWSGTVDIDALTTGEFFADKVEVDLGGLTQNLQQPDARRLTFSARGGARGIIATSAEIAQALGETINLEVDGSWNAGEPVRVAKAAIVGQAIAVTLAGDIADYAFAGKIDLNAASLAPFSGLAARELGGAIDLDANGRIQAVGGGFDLTLDGFATDLAIGTPAADNLLGGRTQVSGRLARGEAGLVADKLSVVNDQIALTADGTFATGAADFGFDFSLADLALVTPQASGRLTATGRAEGTDGRINLTFDAAVPTGTLIGKPLANATAGFKGLLVGGDLSGTVNGNATLDNVPVDLGSQIEVIGGERRLRALSFSAGGARLNGDLTQTVAGLFTGNLTLAADDISTAAALALREASGSVNAEIALTIQDGRQDAKVTAQVQNVVVDAIRVGRADLQASVADLFNVPIIGGSVEASDVFAGGVDVARIAAQATRRGETTEFSADATLKNGTEASAAGSLTPVEDGYRVTVASLDLAQNELAARLLEPTTIGVVGQTITLDGLTVDIGGGRVEASGTVAETLDLQVRVAGLPLAIANTVRPDLALSGVVDGTAAIGGTRDAPEVDFDVQSAEIGAAALREAGLRSLAVDATGATAGATLNVDASITSPEGLRATVAGGVPLTPNGSTALDIELAAFPLAVLDAVVPGQDFGGSVSGTARVTGSLANPAATFDVRGSALQAAALSQAGVASLDAEIAGTFADRALTLSRAAITGPQGLSATATGTVPLAGGPIALDLELAAFPLGLLNAAVPGQDFGGTVTGSAEVSGALANPSATFDIRGQGLRASALSQAGITALDAQAAGEFANRTLTLSRASVTGPQGLSLTAAGIVPLAGGSAALDIELAAFPLGVLNAAIPGQDFGGTATGSARVTGALANPSATFDIRGQGLRAAALAQAGIAGLDLTVEGGLADRTVTLRTASITGPQGLAVSAAGSIPLQGGSMAVNVTLSAFPLGLLNAAAPDQDLGGMITGSASVIGPLANPSASFQLQGSNLVAAALSQAGIGSLDLDASGTYADRTVSIASIAVRGPQGLTLDANGRVPLTGPGLEVNVRAQAPLALANRFLADRGAQLSGALVFSASVGGSLAQPVARGMFSTIGAQFVDPGANVRLRDISIMGTLDGDRITLRSASAAIGDGGTVAASGSLSLNAAAGLPADIRVTLANARYSDGNLLVATLDGSLALTGPILRDPLLSGSINVQRAEITVPDSLGGGAAAIDVEHIRPPADVAATLIRARANDGTPTPTARPSVVRMDVTVTAPNQIFVRGRGLDAEMGGSVRLTGPVTDIQPVGAFDLIRGRLSILGQRITFEEGEVSLVGDLDPFLNFTASSESDDITVFITVRGRVSDLDVSFSSQPNLPEDEVLARLIFDRGLNELSPLQIAQLAAAAAELAGGSETSLLGNLRDATGLDDLDITTDSQGNAAVQAGRYIQDNVYLGLEAGAGGSTRATITLDVTEDLKVRGSAGTDSSLGVFYEKDY